MKKKARTLRNGNSGAASKKCAQLDLQLKSVNGKKKPTRWLAEESGRRQTLLSKKKKNSANGRKRNRPKAEKVSTGEERERKGKKKIISQKSCRRKWLRRRRRGKRALKRGDNKPLRTRKRAQTEGTYGQEKEG